MPVIWSQENDQRLIKAMWESPSKSFGDIGAVFFGHAVKAGSAECQQIMRRIHKLTGKSDSSGTVKASRSPSGVQKKRAGRRRKKSSTPSESDTDGGFDKRVAFPGVQDSSSSDAPPLRSPRVRACKPKHLVETETEGSMDEMEKPVADEPVAGIEE